MAEYRETRTALTWRLVVSGGAVPAGLMLVGVVLGAAVDRRGSSPWPSCRSVRPFPPTSACCGGTAAPGSWWTTRASGSGRPTAAPDSYQASWSAVRSARIETNAAVIDAMMNARRIFSANRYWGVPRGHSHYTLAAGVLVPPFARTVLIVELAELTGIQARPPRPRRYFGNYLNVASFSRRYEPQESSLWLVPSPRPEDLASALAEHGLG